MGPQRAPKQPSAKRAPPTGTLNHMPPESGVLSSGSNRALARLFRMALSAAPPVSQTQGGVVFRQTAGATDASDAAGPEVGPPTLEQAFWKALRERDWQAAAELLNGLNRA